MKRSVRGVTAGARTLAFVLAGLWVQAAYAGDTSPTSLLQEETPPHDAQLAFDPDDTPSAEPVHPWDNNDFSDSVDTSPGVVRRRAKSIPTTPARLSDKDLLTKTPATETRPEQIGFIRNYPNPFNAQTRIEFALEQPGVATLEVYNLLGQVQTRVEWKHLEAGTHSWLWTGQATNGQPVPSGVYFYRLEVDQTSALGRMVLLK